MGIEGKVVIRHFLQNAHLFGNLRQHLQPGLNEGADRLVIEAAAQRLVQIGPGPLFKFLGREGADIFAVHPSQFFHIENRRRLADPLQREHLRQLFQRIDLPLAAGVPSQKGNIVQNRFL